MTRGNGYSKNLEISLRVLHAYTSHKRPSAVDEVYLRELTGDATTPGDELACQVVQAELRRTREPRTLTVGAEI